MNNQSTGFDPKQAFKWGGIGVGVIFLLIFLLNSYVNVDQKEIAVVQYPFSGTIKIYSTAGTHATWWGSVTKYKKSVQYWFDGKDGHQPTIPIKFYDGGHADIPGSIRVDLPLDYTSMVRLHTKYGSQAAIEDQLVGQILIKSVYMAGPTMTSKESYAEKKTDLLYYVEDQAKHGVYKTTQKEVELIDPLSEQKTQKTVVEILKDSSGQPKRLETSLVADLNVTLSNLSFGDFKYDDIVKNQIATQQQAIMQVQTAMAKAKEAEQQAITTEQQGKANAAEAKWKQETIKAQAVTEAEQQLAVAQLNVKTEDANKLALTLKGQGEAAYKAAVTQANNNIELKITAWEKVNLAYADAMKGSQWVPTWVNGGGSGNYSSGAANLIELMTAKSAQDLGINVKPGK